MRAAAALLALIAGCTGIVVPAAARAQERFVLRNVARARSLAFRLPAARHAPAHAVSIEPHSFAIECELGYQNTWALSPERGEVPHVAGIRRPPATLGPRTSRPSATCPARTISWISSPRRSTWRCTTRFRASGRCYGFATGGVVPGRLHGFEHREFHDAVGFSSFGRPAAARNQADIILDLKGAQVTLLNLPETQGFTDPIFGLRYGGIDLPGRWDMSVEVATKVPLEGERMLLSTGHTDYGMQASVRRLGSRNALHMDFSAVYYAGERCRCQQHEQIDPHDRDRLGAPDDCAHQFELAGVCEHGASTSARRPISTNCWTTSSSSASASGIASTAASCRSA